MVRIYGASDDLCEIEGSKYEEDEIGCYDSAVEIGFTDGTDIIIGYPKAPGLAVWGISVLKKGYADNKLIECNDENAEIYSDIFEIDAEVAWHRLIDPEPCFTVR